MSNPYERCTVNSGTTVRIYEFYRVVMNALRDTLYIGTKILKFSLSTLSIALPGHSVVIPIISEGEFMWDEVPTAKVWAMKFTYTNNGYNYSTIVPLLKQPLEDVWRALVAPIDYYIEGTEEWYYTDPDDDFEVKIGTSFTPYRRFGVLGDGGPVARDITLVIMCVYLLNAVGLFKLLQRFFEAVLIKIHDIGLRRQVKMLKQRVIDDHVSLDSLLDSMGVSVTTIDGKLSEIKSLIGIKMLLGG